MDDQRRPNARECLGQKAASPFLGHQVKALASRDNDRRGLNTPLSKGRNHVPAQEPGSPRHDDALAPEVEHGPNVAAIIPPPKRSHFEK